MKQRIIYCLLVLATVALAQESRIELRSHYSTILSIQKNFNIFLPANYDAESGRYPVVYLFRGLEREWANPTEDGSRQGNIKTVADRLFSLHAIGKMILVMPGLSQPGTDADFAYVVNELIPYVDATFRTLPFRQKRGMDGFSYGGYDMLQLLRRSPEEFFTAGAYDGSYWVVNLTDFFAGAGEAYWTQLRSMKFLLHSTPSGNYTSNQEFLAILNAHGITNGFDTLSIGPNSAHNWYFADMHMEKSLPLHWQHFITGGRELPLQLISPAGISSVSGVLTVKWSVAKHTDTMRTFVEYSRDRGSTWAELYSSTNTDTTYSWNTALGPDGTGYMLRVRVFSDTLFGVVQTPARFTVNNPGNATPEVGIIFPDSTRALTGVQTVRWWAEDADGDSLSISLAASTDGGVTWSQLSDQPSPGQYSWDTPSVPNSSSYRLRVRGKDALTVGEALSPLFSIQNPRPILRPSLVEHVVGSADGTVRVTVANRSQVSGHRYRLIFHDSLPGPKTYSVLDIDRGVSVVPSAAVQDSSCEGPLFDGLRLVLHDIDPPRLSKDSTRWFVGSSNLIPDVFPANVDTGTGVLTGASYLSDFQIRVFDHIVDTSSALFGWSATPMNFTVWDVTENHRVNVLFTDLNGDRMISQYDELVLLESDPQGRPMLTWDLFFAGTGNARPPVAGDRFLLKILKSFTRRDVYDFVALPSGVLAVSQTTLPLEFRLEQNYPNPFNPTTEIRYSISGDHVGARQAVRLEVYDLLGREVVVLVDEAKAPGTYTVSFNGRGVASGVYFCRLESGSFHQTIKMALVK